MILLLRAAKATLTIVILALAGLAFLPREAASRLTGAQKFLADEIERRRA